MKKVVRDAATAEQVNMAVNEARKANYGMSLPAKERIKIMRTNHPRDVVWAEALVLRDNMMAEYVAGRRSCVDVSEWPRAMCKRYPTPHSSLSRDP